MPPLLDLVDLLEDWAYYWLSINPSKEERRGRTFRQDTLGS